MRWHQEELRLHGAGFACLRLHHVPRFSDARLPYFDDLRL